MNTTEEVERHSFAAMGERWSAPVTIAQSKGVDSLMSNVLCYFGDHHTTPACWDTEESGLDVGRAGLSSAGFTRTQTSFEEWAPSEWDLLRSTYAHPKEECERAHSRVPVLCMFVALPYALLVTVPLACASWKNLRAMLLWFVCIRTAL